MTKLERATALLPLINKANRKNYDVDLQFDKNSIKIWHWNYFNDAIQHYDIVDKRSFDKAFNYLSNLIK